MEFAFTEEQQQFRDHVARFCHDKSPTTVVRELSASETGFNPGLWQQMCNDLGLVGLHIKEDVGGLGFSTIELGIVMEELARSLLPSPYFSVVLASSAIACGSEAAVRDELMSGLATGKRIATLAINHQTHHLRHHVTVIDDTVSISLKAVSDGQVADFVLLITDDSELLLVETDAETVTLKPHRTLDGTRRLVDVDLNQAPVTSLGKLSQDQIEQIYHTALVALSSEMSGGAQALLATTLEYTKMRIQFGRPIGSFQAIKHRLADLYVDVELAKVAAWQSAAAVASDEEAGANASLAKFTCSEAYLNAALEGIQLRGGIGFTWENDTHLWYRRAKSSEVFLGSPAFHRQRMIEEMS
jgi:alkylation response protein AidB-like acyl-CoA dehydrogenase